MNGQSDLPKWINTALKVGAMVMGVVIAFATLQAQVGATDLLAKENKVKIEKHEDRIDEIQETQAITVTVLKGMQETLNEIRIDVKEHMKDGR